MLELAERWPTIHGARGRAKEGPMLDPTVAMMLLVAKRPRERAAPPEREAPVPRVRQF